MVNYIAQHHRVLAFMGGRILTMDPETSHAEVVMVRGGHIVEVGTKDVLKSHPKAKIVDLNGRTLLPAFIDPHNHLSIACFAPGWAKLDGLAEKGAILDAIRNYAYTHRDQRWIVGFPWNNLAMGGVALTRSDLDKACPDRPVLLIAQSLHSAVVNTEALRVSGLDRSFSEASYGGIVCGNDGKPTGVLHETALAAPLEMASKVTTSAYADLIESRAKELLAHGITAVQDPGVTPLAEDAYRHLYAQKRLPVSILVMPHGETLLDNRLASRLDGPATGVGDEWLRIGPIKIFADGGAEGTMAIAGKVAGTTQNLGVVRDDFANVVVEATQRGFRVCAHTIGNLATGAFLEACERAFRHAPRGFEMRPRIEHVFVAGSEQIKRLAAMGGCAAVQSSYAIMCRPLVSALPFEELEWFPFETMTKQGMVVAGSSDSPCFGVDYAINPIQCAVIGAGLCGEVGEVFGRDNRSPFEQWLWMYTAGAAYVGGMENERGMLKRGLVADLVILDGNLTPEVPPRVAETWKAGERVYRMSVQPG